MRKSFRLPVLALCLVMLLGLLPLAAAQASVKDLDYAYIVAEKAYLVVGEKASWQVKLSHDAEPYSFTYTLYVRENPVDEQMQGVTQTKAIKDTSFSYTVEKEGYYMLQVEVMDKDYRTQRLRSESYLAIPKEAEFDETSPVGKAKAIAAEVTAQNLPNAYEKALWVNNWLTGNAEYDKSMSIHDAAGVLLRGSGVCESYALANQLVLAELDIDSIYVTGYAGGDLHAWNLVNLDGDWTFIDTTWNDPLDGEEGHDYFGLSSRYLSRDHDWGYSNYLYPPAETDKYNYLLNNGALPFDSGEGMEAAFAEALNARQESIPYFYTGTDKYFDVTYEMGRWLKANQRKYQIDSYAYGGGKYSGTMSLTYGNYEGYVSFDTEEGLAPALEQAFSGKPALVKVMYQGSDSYYDISRPLRDWLAANSRRFQVKEYSYNYMPASAEITLSYHDYTGYDAFANQEELFALLQAQLSEKRPQLKLYYTGSDEFYRLPRDVQAWMDAHRDLYKTWGGEWTNVDAVLEIQY